MLVFLNINIIFAFVDTGLAFFHYLSLLLLETLSSVDDVLVKKVNVPLYNFFLLNHAFLYLTYYAQKSWRDKALVFAFS